MNIRILSLVLIGIFLILITYTLVLPARLAEMVNLSEAGLDVILALKVFQGLSHLWMLFGHADSFTQGEVIAALRVFSFVALVLSLSIYNYNRHDSAGV
jgi:hypothetical protein